MIRIDHPAALAASYDIAVIGAGPAGLRAASIAADRGARVLLADENATLGGQIYRAVAASPLPDPAILGAEYRAGASLCAAFEASAASYAPRATLWSVAPGAPGAPFEIGLSQGGTSRLIAARQIILATGAIERPMPVPGWTLPGVLSAGAAQIALKSSALVPEGRVVLAGSGPLLLLLATQLQAAGANIIALLDTTPRANRGRAARHLPAFLASPYFRRGVALLRQTRRLPVHRGITALRIEVQGDARRVTATRGRETLAFDADMVLLHQGVIPDTAIANALGCALRHDPVQHCWTPVLDPWFAAGLPGLAIAGDAAGIGGAESAAWRGEIAALGALARMGSIGAAARDEAAAGPRRRLAAALRGRAFLDDLYRPAAGFLAPPDDATIVCRCEEITAGAVRDITRRLAVPGPNQLKAFLRCGMGPCQGRLCAPTVTALMAETRGVSPAEIGCYRLRPPFKPITVAEFASLPQSEAAIAAVVR